MTTSSTDLVKAAAARFQAQRAQATARHAKARSDATALRARNRQESQEMMAEAKRRKNGEPEDRLITSPWPQAEAARYQFDDSNDDAPEAVPEVAPRPAPAREPVRAERSRRVDDDDDDNMSEVDTWLR